MITVEKGGLGENKPGFDESVAGVHNVVHLQVDGGVHDCHNQTFLERQTGGVHELQQDGEALRVHLWVQTDGIKVALVGVREERVEEPTVVGGTNTAGRSTSKPQQRGGGKHATRRDEVIPASHEDGLVRAKLLPAHQDRHVGEDVSASQPVQVEQHVARVARELDAAVCCASHFPKICKPKGNILGSVKNRDFSPEFFFFFF